MERKGIKLCLLLILSFFVEPGFSQKLLHLSYGDHEVGFQSSLNVDYSRPARAKNQFGRAVQINVWYPAKISKEPIMDFKQYLYLQGEEDSVTRNAQNNLAVLNSFLAERAADGADTSSWKNFLNHIAPMKARRNAPLQKGNFPVVHLIHSPAMNYCLLGELLASYGMIVINVPYKGYLQNTFDVNVQGMETEIRDQEYAFGVVVKKLEITPTAAGLVGLSFGGQSAVGMAVRNSLIKGVVSLDGGIGSTFGPQLLSGHPSYHPEKVRMPIIHLYNPEDPGGNVNWFDEVEFNDRYLVAFKNMDHSFFGIYGSLDNEINHVLGKDKPKTGNNAEAILLYTLTFFRELFTTGLVDASVLTDLDKKNSWLTSSIQSIVYKKTKFNPLPLDYLQGILNANGIEALLAEHEKQKVRTTMPIAEGSYRSLFLEVFGKQDKLSTLKISVLYEGDFPQSALAKYYRGRALMLNNQDAKAAFSQCLSLLAGDSFLSQTEKETIKSRAQGFITN